MPLSKTEFEKLVNEIKSHKTETAYVDCKEELHLDQDGDKASFIRDIAALANNTIESYLIIGIQNKTWAEIGLQDGSLFADTDQTQSRMNQILENKLDPQLSVRYQTIELNGHIFGIVNVRGNRAPYLISIDDAQYGGNKTKGKPTYILRGAIYVRHGDTTIIANRQSRIFEIIKTISSEKTISDRNPLLQDFMQKNNYYDVESPDFGSNLLTQDLLEKRWDEEARKNLYLPAKSWVSFVFFPLDEPCSLDLPSLQPKLQPNERIGRGAEWFQGLPNPISEMFQSARATPKGLTSKFTRGIEETEKYTQAINIFPNGVIHYAASYPLFYQYKNFRFYSFVSLIGYLWQLLYLAKAIFQDADCIRYMTIIMNFSGAKGTVLSDLARGKKEKWIDIHDWQYPDVPRDICQEKNIQLSRELLLPDLSDDQAETLIRDIAKEIGQYFNQSTPKCFTPDTNEFPIQQFHQSNNW